MATAHPLPERLEVVLETAASNLARRVEGHSPLAVRSSALDEDGAHRSFAGRHATELGVHSAGVEAAVRRCWASLWCPAAVSYRAANGLPFEGCAMPVLVQALVPADAAAVVFTVDPVADDEDRIVVNATRGLGTPLVSGAVTADTIVLDRQTKAPCAATRGDRPAALTPESTVELVDLALRAEELLGEPVDVEAAYDGRTWHLVQARPVTTVTPAGPSERDDLVLSTVPSFGAGARDAEPGGSTGAKESARVA
jgi:phosphoenolpyruvate synthase/pyruvate phosphate dikinase